MADVLLWSIAETARQLGGVSTRTIERLINDGDLPIIYIRKRRMVEAEVVRRLITVQNERARARMEEIKPCQEKIAMASTNSRAHRTGTGAIPMRTESAAAAVRERIAKLRQKQF